jgi:hypothetical protein
MKQVVLVRSVSSVFCVDAQIRDWPKAIRAYGAIEGLKVTAIEEYTEDDLSATVFGELLECLKSFSDIPLAAVFVFVHEGISGEDALLLAQVISGKEELNRPEYWRYLTGPE